MISIATFRHRVRPVLALTVGGVAFFLIFASLYRDATQEGERHVANNSLEYQVAEFLSGPQKAKDNPSLSGRILGYRDREEAAACVAEIRRLFGTTDAANLSPLSVEARNTLLQDKNCGFFEPKVTDKIYVTEYLRTALLVGVLVALLVATWAWVATFPHTGWRRLALVLGPIAGVVTSIVLWWLEELGPLGIGVTVVATTTIVAVGCLAALIAYEWIRRGFNAEGKDEA